VKESGGERTCLHQELLSHPQFKISHPEGGRLIRAGLRVNSTCLQVVLCSPGGTSVVCNLIISKVVESSLVVFGGTLLIPVVLAISVLLDLLLLLLLLQTLVRLLAMLKGAGIFGSY